jgi:chaperonin GroES
MANLKKKSKKKATKSAKRSTPSARPVQNALGVTPLADGVLIKPVEAETKTAFGIYIPDTAQKEKTSVGRVVATGPGKVGDDNELVPMTVKAGDKVYFSQGWDNEFEWQGEKYFLVRESDVKAILD